MSEPYRDEIVLRHAPGRDATSSEIVRERGELRRRPHLTVASINVQQQSTPGADAGADVPMIAPAAVPPARPAEPGAANGEYGRRRLIH